MDDFSKFSFVFFLKGKFEVPQVFENFHKFVTTQQGIPLKIIRSDNGGEFVNKRMTEFCHKNGILHQTSIPYTPQQNGVAERLIRTLSDITRCLLIDSGVDEKFWAEAMNHGNYIRNRVPLSDSGIIPFEIWFGKKIKFPNLFPFGSSVMFRTNPTSTKFAPRAQKGIFIGVSETSKGYRIFIEGRIIISRDVNVISRNPQPNINVMSDVMTAKECVKVSVSDLPSAVMSSVPQPPEVPAAVISSVPQPPEVPAISEDFGKSRDMSHIKVKIPRWKLAEASEKIHEPEPEEKLEEKIVVRIPRENVIRPEKKSENVPRFMQPLRRSARESKKPEKFAFLGMQDLEEPSNLQSAIQGEEASEWRSAVNEEFQSLQQNNTWEISDLPEGRKAIGCRWIFKRKRDKNGAIIRYKARLVAKGYSQTEGIDYQNVYSPVVNSSALRTILAFCVTNGFEIIHMDVDSAYLNPVLDTEIYMQAPEGFELEKGKVLLLKKGLYGLKQAGYLWNEDLNRTLLHLGFKRLISDPCIYISGDLSNGDLIIITTYVDDIIISSQSEERLRTVKIALQQKYRMKDLGDLNWFLGVTFEKTSTGAFLHQSSYVKKLLDKYQMQNCRGVSTPVEVGTLADTEMKSENDDGKIKEAVGELMWLSNWTRPDIAFAVNYAARNPTWHRIKRILRYLQNTKEFGINYSRGELKNGLELFGYGDADFGSDVSDRKSITGFIFFVNRCAVSWASRKQETVSLSTTEAEHVASVTTAREAVWLAALLKEITGQDVKPHIFSDSQSSIALAKNSQTSRRTKHMDIKYFYLRGLLQENKIILDYMPTDKMVADALTKPLAKEKFNKLIKMMLNPENEWEYWIARSTD
jgi:hypothetical protein